MDVPRQARWDLPHDRAAVSKSRQLVHEALREWKSADLADVVALVVSELTTNAIAYAEPPVSLQLQMEGRCVGGEVSDHGGMFEPPPAPDPEATSGRGLHIVDALVTKWGVDPTGNGKVVWFRICNN